MTNETNNIENIEETPIAETVSVEEFNAVKEQLAVALEGINKLKDKNSEIIGEKRNLQAKLADQGDIESLANIRREYDEAKEALNAQLAEKDSLIEAKTQQLQALMTTDVLRAELNAAGVREGLLDGAMAVLGSRVSVVEEDGSMKAVFDGSISIADGVREWSEGAGKDYVASTSNGAGFPKSDNTVEKTGSSFYNPTQI